MEEQQHVTRHYVDPLTPLYEETIRATGIVPEPFHPPVVVIQPTEPVWDEAALDQIVARQAALVVEAARPTGSAAVVAISEPTATLPRPHKQSKQRQSPTKRRKGR